MGSELDAFSQFGGTCPCCAKRFKALPPQGLEPGSPFGPNLRAFVVYLRFTQGISFERLAKLLSDILGLDISEGALVNMLEAARDPFAAQTSLIRARLLSGTALESDETGVRVGKRNWWLWVFHHKDSAVFVADPSRGKSVVSTAISALISGSPTATAASSVAAGGLSNYTIICPATWKQGSIPSSITTIIAAITRAWTISRRPTSTSAEDKPFCCNEKGSNELQSKIAACNTN